MLDRNTAKDLLAKGLIDQTGIERERERHRVCKKMDGQCYRCPYQDLCEEEELLNSLDEW